MFFIFLLAIICGLLVFAFILARTSWKTQKII
jgi:hypothetical protein